MTTKIDLNMNALRSLAILLVVLLHVNAESLMHLFATDNRPTVSFEIMQFYSILTRIAVPIFILISGRYIIAAVGSIPLKKFYSKRIFRLLIPLLFWSFIYFFVCAAQNPATTISSYLNDFFTGFAHNSMAIHLWYLYMLLPLYLVAPLLYKAIHFFSPSKQIYFAIALCIFGTIIETVKNITGINLWFLWCLEFIGLFACGFVLRDTNIHAKRHLLLIASFGLEIIATVYTLFLFAQNSEFAFIFYWGVVPHTQIVAVFIYLYFNAKTQTNNYLVKFSSYVLGIYLIHFLFIPLLGLPNYTGILFVDILLKTAVIYFISLLSIYLLSKIKILKKVLQ